MLVGLSDHTLGCGVAVRQFPLVRVLLTFPHFRKDGGVDSEFSLRQEFILVQEVRNAWQAIGSISYGPSN